MPSVELREVSKSYGGGRPAVDRVSLAVPDGQLLVLVGPSGCGKSTLLRMIAGLEEVGSGQIKIGERVVNDVAPKDRDIAMVFQNYALYPHLSVGDNMAFGLKLRRVPATEVALKVKEVASMLGLEGMLGRKPRELSGGERQRVALGRALVRDPHVFLFDEPLSNLDAKLRVQMRAEIHRLHQRLGATMVYVTHDQVEAMTLGDRIAVLRDGVLQQVAEPERIYRQPANVFVAGFIGSPPMNFLRVHVAAEGAPALEADGARMELPSHWSDMLSSWRGRPVVAGVRPEHLGYGAPDAGTGIEAEVELREPLGAETLVHWRTSAGLLVARVTSGNAPPLRERARLRAPAAAWHLFDPQTERAFAPTTV